MPELDPAAVAQPEQPAPISADVTSAVDQAVATKDVASFREARQAERSGKPLTVPTEPATPASRAASEATREVSKRQQQINDYERRIATQEAELARLRTAPAPPQTVAPPAPAPEKFQSFDAYQAQHPDDTYEDYQAAHIEWMVDRREAKRTEEQQRTARQQQDEQRVGTWTDRVKAHVTADPDFLTTLSPDVLALRPFSALEPGESPTAMNAIAEEIVSSPVSPLLMRHFSDHPEDLTRMSRLSPRDLLRDMGKLEAALERPAGRPPIPVTRMPAPTTTLGTKTSDPTNALDAAVGSQDVSAFRAERLRQRMATMR